LDLRLSNETGIVEGFGRLRLPSPKGTCRNPSNESETIRGAYAFTNAAFTSDRNGYFFADRGAR
jgi:hypothetical protein